MSEESTAPVARHELAAIMSARIRAAREKAQLENRSALPDKIKILQAANLLDERETRKLMSAHRAETAPTPSTIQPGQPASNALDKFVTCDKDLLRIKEMVKRLAPVSYPVLIRGESGTGKELIAKALHGNRTGPFVAINCAAISENLIESELFGHTKGSFTGAHVDRAGLLLRARGGTAFLDEIGDLPYPLQAKLLRAIQNKVIRRVGSNDDEAIDCRIVAATHVDIESVLNDKFRLDLYYRLSTFILQLKPLRERTYDDFSLIVKSFGGSEADLEHLWLKRAQLVGNFRDVEQYFIRKHVLGDLATDESNITGTQAATTE